MRVRILSTPDAVARLLSLEVSRIIGANPSTVLGLPTGRTPVRFYSQLSRLYARGQIDFSRVSTFNVDEFVGVGADHPGSYHAYMRRHLFDHVNIARPRQHLLDGRAGDLVGECARYERAIKAAGGIDLLILGLGPNGHIGFNEPASSLAALTHRATLHDQTRRANAPLFGHRLSAVPREGLSMGMATILRARTIVLVAIGAGKSACVARMLEGPITTRLPASFLQLHPAVEFWLDRAAARRLRPTPSRPSAPASTGLRRPRRSRP